MLSLQALGPFAGPFTQVRMLRVRPPGPWALRGLETVRRRRACRRTRRSPAQLHVPASCPLSPLRARLVTVTFSEPRAARLRSSPACDFAGSKVSEQQTGRFLLIGVTLKDTT